MMAIGAYIGVENAPHKVKEIYIGVNGKPARVTAAYIGVNNMPALFYQAEKRLGDLAVGSIVVLNVDGKATNFIIVHQGLPDTTVYDASCNGAWLLSQNIYGNLQWHSTNENVYERSAMHTYLNSTWLKMLDTSIQNSVKQIKIPYRQNGGSGGTDTIGTSGLQTKVFLLSADEVGFTNGALFPEDGTKLDYFLGGSDWTATSKRVAWLQGKASFWWLRSPYINDSSDVCLVRADGTSGLFFPSNSYGIRPAFILPSNHPVDNNNMVI